VVSKHLRDIDGPLAGYLNAVEILSVKPAKALACSAPKLPVRVSKKTVDPFIGQAISSGKCLKLFSVVAMKPHFA
jgi:hypothetical protein